MTLAHAKEFNRALEVPVTGKVTSPRKGSEARLEIGWCANALRTMGKCLLEIANRTKDPLCLRASLMTEELGETLEAALREDNEACLDGLCDMAQVMYGTALEWGFGDIMDDAEAETLASNLSKLGRDGKPIKSPGGRVLKGPDFRQPDYSKLLKEIGK